VLDQIFEGKFIYKTRGNYIIIATEKETNNDRYSINFQLIKGYVLDSETREGVQDVSVFSSSGENTLTDEIGAFKIRLKKEDNGTFELRKKGFEPISYSSQKSQSGYLEFYITPIQSLSVTVERDTTLLAVLPTPKTELKILFPVNISLKTNQENIQDTIYKPISFSLYPGIATYGNLSGNIIYNFALNFVGYNRGISGAEFAFLSNINKENVIGVQLAGLSNYVGRDVHGFQAAGVFNKIGGTMKGLQMAGISNVNFGKVKGAQLAGISNHAFDNAKGLQMSGIFNQADTIQGAQIGGVMNIAKKSTGIQMSGIGNHAHTSSGLQLAGVYNLAENVKGMQISGVVNIAKTVEGSQLGIINIADSMTGIPIGILNLIKNGYKRIGFYSDEIIPYNLVLKTGVQRFYSILSMGVQSDLVDSDDAFYAYGFGFGSSKKLTNTISLDLDVTNHVLSKKKNTGYLSSILKGYLGLEYKVVNRLSIAGGVSYNAHYFDRELLADPDFDQLRDNYIIDTSDDLNNQTIWRSWVGYRIGINMAL
jgi:hypothetical protein